MRPRLLFTYLKPTSFVRDDLALLQDAFDVRPFHFAVEKGQARWETAAQIVRTLHRQRRWLRDELPQADAVVGWFADFHLAQPAQAAVARMLPLAVVVGGYDGNTVPELGYGVMASRWRAPLARRVLRQASHLYPVSHSLVCDENRYLDAPALRRTGLCASAPGLATPLTVIPLGVDPAVWPMGPAERVPLVSTVAYLGDHRTVRVKGIDLLIEAARRLPDVRIDIVGVTDAFRPTLTAALRPPPNVTLHPPVAREALAEVYHRTSVYAQLSRIEAGLPMVLAEAMLCGCIPIGSRVGGIPETMGGVGVDVAHPDPDAIAAALRQALDGAEKQRWVARERIATHFTLAQRGERLIAGIQALLDGAQRNAAP